MEAQTSSWIGGLCLAGHTVHTATCARVATANTVLTPASQMLSARLWWVQSWASSPELLAVVLTSNNLSGTIPDLYQSSDLQTFRPRTSPHATCQLVIMPGGSPSTIRHGLGSLGACLLQCWPVSASSMKCTMPAQIDSMHGTCCKLVTLQAYIMHTCAGLTTVMLAWNRLEGTLPGGMGTLPLQVWRSPSVANCTLGVVCMAHGNWPTSTCCSFQAPMWC